MTKDQYSQFKLSVERNLAHLTFVSTGACPGCSECGLSNEPSDSEIDSAGESHFSWHACESCGSHLGGDRHPAHGRDANGAIMHFAVCSDCLYFLNYGQLDDMSMLEMEAQ